MPNHTENKRIGIFGGSFNPVHIGHYAIVRELFKQQLVNELHIFPAALNPLKKNAVMIDDKTRIVMLEKTMADFPKANINLFEIQSKGISYTANTVRYMQKMYTPPLFLIMGYDCYQTFHLWRDADFLAAACNLVVFDRKGTAPEVNRFFEDKPTPAFVHVDLPDISATTLRKKKPSADRYIHPAAQSEWQRYLSL